MTNMTQLSGKRIILGVTGGIAAYKSVLLLRLLRKTGAEVRVVMTKNASKFVTSLTFQALSDRAVHSDLFNGQEELAMGHIELSRWADIILIAPASANFINHYANGFADNLLSTICLATTNKVILAPAMNHYMWMNMATQESVDKLKKRGVLLLGPAQGEQACGEDGPGRMVEPNYIIEEVSKLFKNDLLAGLSLLVTAGPTREPIDPVRFISNRSSGLMGYSIVNAALEAGAKVNLISGPVNLPKPACASVINVTTTQEMQEAVIKQIHDVDIFISVAAVSDYRLKKPAEQKIKKNQDSFELVLQKNPDILSEVAMIKNAPFTVGFAAETENIKKNAKTKLQKKKIDMIVANKVGEALGFELKHNELYVLWQTGHKKFAKTTKQKLAIELIKLIAKKYNEKNTN